MVLLLLLGLVAFLLALQLLLLQLSNGSSIIATVSNTPALQCATVEAWTIVVVTMSNNLATTHNDGAMAIVQRRLRGLLEAQRQVVVGLHFDF